MDNGGRTADKSSRMSFEFLFNGRRVTAYEGDSVASALVRAGEFVFSRSMKFHRPRGLYCGASRCFSCAMRVNGVPGVRTCATRAEKGMVVESEGGFPSTKRDMLSVLDVIFMSGFEYSSRFVRPAFMVPVYQRMVRKLSTPRKLPETSRDFPPLESLNTDVLVVGQGRSGRAACARLRRLGIQLLVVDRHGTEMHSPSVVQGFYEGRTVLVLTETAGMVVHPRAVLIATGTVESAVPVVNGDMPGVMLPDAVEHLVRRGVRPGREACIIGDSPLRSLVLGLIESSGTEIVGDFPDPDKVLRIAGRSRVRGVDVVSGDGRPRRVKCDLVVLLGPLVPYVNLAQQAGCELRPRDGQWYVMTGPDGRTSVDGVFACGSVAGFLDEASRTRSGERAADGIARYLGVA